MYCIFLAGAPASGKSTVAAGLSQRLQIPMISKDSMKELLFDTIGFQSRSEKVALGVASAAILHYMASQLMQSGQPFLLENNFEPDDRNRFTDLVDQYRYQAITIRLTAQPDTLYSRFAARERDSSRHLGHIVNDRYPRPDGVGELPPPLSKEAFLKGIQARGFDRFCIGTCIEVDTTDFARVDLDALTVQVRQRIGA